MTKKTQPKFRSTYNTGTLDYGITHTDGKTEQHHKNACDINLILAQFMETGIMPPTNTSPQYGDVSGHNFQEAQNQIALAKTLFEELPEHVRSRFENEPYKFLQFAQDENNYDQMVEMGLANAPTFTLEDEALPSGGIIPSNSEAVPGTIPKATKEAPQGDS
jgi:hypothetical protein